MAFAQRLRDQIEEIGLSPSEVARRAGISTSALSRYTNAQSFPNSEQLFPLCDVLVCDPRWLISGQRQAVGFLADAEEADWINIGEYDLRDLDHDARGLPKSTTPFRRDWLNRTLGQVSGLWLARLPADLPAVQLREGDLVFLQDVQSGEAQDGAIYIVRTWGHLTVARLDALQDTNRQPIESNLADRRIAFRHIGHDDGQAVLVARVLGVPLKRL